jgi:hypothetical protein
VSQRTERSLARILAVIGVAGAVALLVAACETGVGPAPSAQQPVSSHPLDRSRHNCAPHPSTCGYPDATNTGVPAGTTLRAVPSQVRSGPGWHWDSRGWVEIDGDGATFSHYSVAANVDVTASGAVVTENRISVRGQSFGVSVRHARNVRVQHNTISSPVALGRDRLLVGVKDIYGDATGLRVRANNISHASTAVQLDDGVVTDNYIHDFGFTSGDHLNGIMSNGGRRPLTISHNTVLNSYAQTDAIGLFEDFGVQTNRTVTNNLLGGGGYSLYAGANPGGARTSNIRITDNRFAVIFFPASGRFGPYTAFDPAGPGNVWAGNIRDDTGAPVKAAA